MMFFRRLFSSQSGAAAAEMALIAPLGVLMFFTAVESGHYIYAQQQLVKAVRDGARFGARQPFDEVNCRTGSGVVSAQVQSAVRAIALTGALTGSSERRSGWDSSEISFVVSATCPSTAEATDGIYAASEPAAVINVAATIGYDSLFGGLGIINDSFSLNGEQNAVVSGI
ncbi:MAG: TadE family protein [Erythrobacter sp.]